MDPDRRAFVLKGSRAGLAVMGVAVMLECLARPAAGQGSKTSLLGEFERVYLGSAADPGAVGSTYGRWLELRREELGGLPRSLRDDVLSGLVADRVRAIEADTAERRPIQLACDRLWIEVWPIDKRSEAFARRVKRGEVLPGSERAMAERDQEQLRRLNLQVVALPTDLQAQFHEAVSESTLDLIYALHGGSWPSSMRLGRGE